MEPYQQSANPAPAQYDFITNPGKPPKKSLFGGGKNSLLVMIIAGLGLLTLIILLGSLLFGGASDKDQLLILAKKQSEVIAVAQLGAEDGGTNQTLSFALAVQLAVTSEQQGVINQINKSGKVKAKDYTALPSAEVTTQLEAAQRNGRFDEVFVNVMRQELNDYQKVLQATNSTASSPSTKELLAQDFKSVELLLEIPAS